MIRVVVSGPSAAQAQVQTALAGVGLTGVAPETATGMTAPAGHVFVSGNGQAIDRVVDAMKPFGWVLRAHWPLEG